MHSPRAIEATIWSSVGVYTNRFITIGISAVLSRLLTPEDFGTIAMVTVISGFLSIFAEAGIGSAVVQFGSFQNQDYQTLSTLSILLGLLLSGVLAISSHFIAVFFNNPALQSIALVMSLAFPISALGIIPRGLLQRDMRFREIAIGNILAALISGFVGMTMAYLGWGYWALVSQALMNSFVASCVFIKLSQLVLVPRWDRRVVHQIFSYSGNLTMFSLINYWARNLDNFLIGKFLGSAPLGLYSRAYQLMMLPITMLISVISPVLHSILAKKQDDTPEMYRAYKEVVRFIALISIPGMTFAIIMAPELIRLVWGSQWEQAIPVFAILGLNGLFQPIMSTTGTAFLARNKAEWLFISGIISTAMFCTGICIGLPYGITGVATGYTIASSLFVLPLMFFVFVKLLNGKFVDFLITIKFPSIFSLISAPFILVMANIARQNLTDIFVFISILAFYSSLYIISIYIFERDFYKYWLNHLHFITKRKISKS